MFFFKKPFFMKYYKTKELFILILLSLTLFFSSINSLPVLDRDEARYAQSSKQMIEKNNYLSIKFQDEYRSKKPIGIYWLQATSVRLLATIKQKTTTQYEVTKDSIWKYRIISSIAALLSIILLYKLGSRVFGNIESFYGAIIMSCSLLFIAEAHIAKTDSVLIMLTIIVMLSLANFYIKRDIESNIFNLLCLWVGLGISFLVKGPILLIIFAITVLILYLFSKDKKWFYKTKPIIGILIIALISLPWFLSISVEEQKNFLNESIINDFFGKIIEVKENHGAFPGFHFLGLWIFFFPFSLFLLPIIYYFKKHYKEKKIFFLIAWILPNFLIMELIPTKLPHYVLPLYPAISLALGTILKHYKINKYLFTLKFTYFGYFIYFLISNFIIFSLYFALKEYGIITNFNIINIFILLILNNFTFVFLYKKEIIKSFFYLIFFANVFTLVVYLSILPNLKEIWISKDIAEVIKNDNKIYDPKLISALGYNEPSLVFEIGTDIKIYKNIENFIHSYKSYNYLIIEESYYKKLNEIVNDNNLGYNKIGLVKGFNASKGDWVEVFILKAI